MVAELHRHDAEYTGVVDMTYFHIRDVLKGKRVGFVRLA
jgi:hypothetical protein